MDTSERRQKLAWFLQSRRRCFRAGGAGKAVRELRLLPGETVCGSGPGVVTGKQRNGLTLSGRPFTLLPSEGRGGGYTRLGVKPGSTTGCGGDAGRVSTPGDGKEQQ